MMNPYMVLGVDNAATPEQIKTAYRKLAMQFHPDRNTDPAAGDRFREITAAYDMIKDGAPAWGSPNMGFRDGPIDFEDIRRAFYHHTHHRNRDVEALATITLEQAFHGAEADVLLPAGRTARVSIPRGIDNGNRIRLSGLGERTLPGAPGDLIVIVRVSADRRFIRNGQTLTTEREICAFDAILGTQIDVDGIDGQRVRIAIPAGVQGGQMLRVSGHGMPILNTPSRGDLMVRVSVRTPVGLSPEARAMVESAKQTSSSTK